MAAGRTRLAALACRDRLAQVAGQGLRRASDRAGRWAVPVPRLADVYAYDWVRRADGAAVLPLRWQAIGPAGCLFAALAADLTLAAGGLRPRRCSWMRSTARRRRCLASLADPAALELVATATAGGFLARTATAVTT
jgi:hypothetical protein